MFKIIIYIYEKKKQWFEIFCQMVFHNYNNKNPTFQDHLKTISLFLLTGGEMTKAISLNPDFKN